jgi:hypothetical protein
MKTTLRNKLSLLLKTETTHMLNYMQVQKLKVFALFFLFKMGYLMRTAEMYFYNDRLLMPILFELYLLSRLFFSILYK